MSPTDLHVRDLGTETVHAAACSHVGAVRDCNEDAHLALVEDGVFVVADGLGGHPAGEVASRLAVAALAEELGAGRAARCHDRRALLHDVLRSAHQAVRDGAEVDPARRGMGTTAVVCHVDPGSGCATFGHVGDSRLYLRAASGTLERLTHDHRRALGGRTVLTQALGTPRPIDPTVAAVDVARGDRLLLCTDGLTAMVPDRRLAELLAGPDVHAVCADLVAAALDAGGRDNVTVLVVELG